MKKICVILSLLMLVLTGSAGLSAQAVSVVVDGVDRTEEFTPRLIDGTTYVPWRAFCGLFGAEVSYDAQTDTALARTDEVSLSVCRSDCYITAAGRCLYLPLGVLTEEGRMYVPLRTLAAAFGAEVQWESAASTAVVWEGDGAIDDADSVYDREDLYWLSRIIEAESGGESFLGKLAVGGVVMNRVANDDYPDSVHAVVFDDAYGIQFTPAATGSVHNTPSKESVAAAKLCLEGTNAAGESLYFLNPDTAESSWIVSNRDYVMTIGGHDFYA